MEIMIGRGADLCEERGRFWGSNWKGIGKSSMS